jgi:hypothetical protein
MTKSRWEARADGQTRAEVETQVQGPVAHLGADHGGHRGAGDVGRVRRRRVRAVGKSDLTSTIEVASVDEGGSPAAKPQGKPLTGAIDLLLLGVDTRQNQDEDNARSDTIIMLHVPASHDEAYLISIPRHTIVDSPAWPKSGWNGGSGKITEMYYHGSQRDQGWRAAPVW